HCHIVSLIHPQPPCSTLFPYTTLFRSDLLEERLLANRRTPVEVKLVLSRIEGEAAIRPVNTHYVEEENISQHLGFGLERILRCRDRKSTRLNSSHEWISYAVFCLKKKN